MTVAEVLDEEGATMIVFLQKLAGIEESFDHALVAWQVFSEMERKQTKAAFWDLGSWKAEGL